MKAQQRTWEIVEAAKSGDKASRIFDISILSLIALNVVAVIIGSVQSIQNRWGSFLNTFEIISVMIFPLSTLLVSGHVLLIPDMVVASVVE